MNNWLTEKLSRLSTKGGGRPDFFVEEDEYGQATDSKGHNSYIQDQKQYRPEPIYDARPESLSKWTKNEIIIVASLSTFVLLVLTMAMHSAVVRNKMRKKNGALNGAHHSFKKFGEYELDIEDPACWGEGRGLSYETKRGREINRVEPGEGVFTSKISKDYKMAAMEMMNSRVESSDTSRKLHFGF